MSRVQSLAESYQILGTRCFPAWYSALRVRLRVSGDSQGKEWHPPLSSGSIGIEKGAFRLNFDWALSFQNAIFALTSYLFTYILSLPFKLSYQKWGRGYLSKTPSLPTQKNEATEMRIDKALFYKNTNFKY